MACCIDKIGYAGLNMLTSHELDTSPSCSAQARFRATTSFSQSDLESSLSESDVKLSQWSARLKERTMFPTASVAEVSVADETRADRVYVASAVRSRPSCNSRQERDPCDLALLGSMAAYAIGSWLLSDVFKPPAGSMAARTAAAVTPRTPPGRTLRGLVLIRKEMQDDELRIMKPAVREALADLLVPATGHDLRVHMNDAKRLLWPRTASTEMLETCASLSFEVTLADEHDRAAALEALRLEAATGGALKLMPSIAKVVRGKAARLALRLEISSERWMLAKHDGYIDLADHRDI